MRCAQFRDVFSGESLVHFAAAVPGDDLDAGLRRDVLRQILIRQEDDAIRTPFTRRPFNDSRSVRRRAAHVAFGFHIGRSVDVSNDRHARKALLDQAHIRACDRSGERAARAHVRDQHRFLRRQNLRGLGHKVDAGLYDDGGIRLRRFARELQRVASEIADAVEDLGGHVIVREDDGVLRHLHLVDRRDKGRVSRPLDGGHDVLDLLIEMVGLGPNFRYKGEAPANNDVESAPGPVDSTRIAAALGRRGKGSINNAGHLGLPGHR